MLFVSETPRIKDVARVELPLDAFEQYDRVRSYAPDQVRCQPIQSAFYDDHAATESGHGRNGLLATTTVVPAVPRSEPSGATPPVTVMRRRASSWPLAESTSHAAARSESTFGTGSPRPDAEWTPWSTSAGTGSGGNNTGCHVYYFHES